MILCEIKNENIFLIKVEHVCIFLNVFLRFLEDFVQFIILQFSKIAVSWVHSFAVEAHEAVVSVIVAYPTVKIVLTTF